MIVCPASSPAESSSLSSRIRSTTAPTGASGATRWATCCSVSPDLDLNNGQLVRHRGRGSHHAAELGDQPEPHRDRRGQQRQHDRGHGGDRPRPMRSARHQHASAPVGQRCTAGPRRPGTPPHTGGPVVRPQRGSLMAVSSLDECHLPAPFPCRIALMFEYNRSSVRLPNIDRFVSEGRSTPPTSRSEEEGRHRGADSFAVASLPPLRWRLAEVAVTDLSFRNSSRIRCPLFRGRRRTTRRVRKQIRSSEKPHIARHGGDTPSNTCLNNGAPATTFGTMSDSSDTAPGTRRRTDRTSAHHPGSHPRLGHQSGLSAEHPGDR